jgi:hypothetical protein
VVISDSQLPDEDIGKATDGLAPSDAAGREIEAGESE